MTKLIGSVSIILSVSLMVGCSGDYEYVNLPADPGYKAPVKTSLSGTGIDGVIEGATVCIDVNNNNACDADEPTDITDVFGKFDLDSSGVTGTLLLTGGKDMGTGLPFTGSLKAPAGSTVVTPLTSAVQALVETGKSADDAEKTIKTALGIPASVDVTTYDPFEEVKGADAVNAQAVLAAQAELQTIVHAVSSTVAGADTTTSIADAMGTAMATIAVGLETAVAIAGDDAPVELTKELVVTATKAVANTVYADKPEALVATKAVAEEAAVAAVAVAADTKSAVQAADVTNSASIELAFNTGMIVTNDSLEKLVEEEAAKAAIEAAKLDAAALKAISDAQIAQEAAEAAIVAKALALAEATAAAEKAAAELKAAGEAATQAQIVAAAQAEAEAQAAKAAKEAAKAAAAQAAQNAAAEEAKIAAAAAQAKEDAAKLAAAEAEAAQKLAEAEEAAAAQAAEDAAAATDAAAAAKAAQDALEAAEKDIADAQAAADEAAKAAADAAAEEKRLADEAAAKAAAEAKEAAEEAAAAAAKEEAAAKECTDAGGEMVDGECVMPEIPDPDPLPTGGVSF